jgi:autotransporter-associated beta strand protein
MFFPTLRRDISALFAGTILSGLLVAPVQGADKTWTGGGANNSWSAGANWGGIAPVNGDNLIFSGTTRPNNTNDISSFSAGWLQFTSGGFTLNGNALTLNPPGSGMFTNLAGTNLIALDLNLVPSGKNWNIAAGSELRLSGAVTNSAGANALITLIGGGTLRITSTNFLTSRAMTLGNGTVIIDGGLADHNNDGIRFVPATGGTVTARVINDGTWRIGGGGNFRLGFGGSGSGSLSQMFLESGALVFYGNNASGGNIYLSEVAGAEAVFNQDGGLVWFSGSGGNTVNIGTAASGNATYNLNGGTLWAGQIVQGNAGAANAVFNFNGGTLKPIANSTTFFQGLQAAYVKNGGAIIDTTNFDITIGQDLLAAGGGLTKLGTGTLTLSGTSTYAGGTVVSNGTLLIGGQLDGDGPVNVAGGILGGTGIVAGPVTVQPGGTLSPGVSVGTITLQNNLTLAGNTVLEVDKSLAATNDFVQVGGTLTNAGASTLTITNLGPGFAPGDSFKFFSKPVLNGDAVVFSPSTPGADLAWTNKLAVDGTVGIVSVPLPPTPADMIGLTLSVGTLSPAFNSNVLSYTASAPYTNSTVALTPTSANPGATIRVICNGATNLVVSGTASSPVALKAGENVIEVQVTAPDNSVTKDFVVNFTRVPPNIIVILADDQGFSDWGCYGSEIPTPNIDRLASEGLRFRQFYNCARCSPTRCSIMTGLYTAQVAVDPAASLPNLRNDNNVTIAELLGANGYRTYMSGKWHLGNGALLPEARGFDEVFRYVSGTDHSEDTWDTNRYTLVSPDGEITNRIYGAGEFYQPDAIGDYSLDFINNDLLTHGGDRPFFLYMAFGSAHFPVQAPKDWVDTNAPIYAQGWDYIRNWRYTNMLAKGVIDPHYGLSPNEGTAPWSNVPAEMILPWSALSVDRQADLTRRMAIYAAMIQKMDQNIGRVAERLRELGQLDNTLIFALSDNGGNYEGGVYGLTGGTSDAAPLTGTALENMGLSGQPVIYLGGGWAHVSNTPFRLYKHFNHGGGCRTPLIIHWPDGLTRTNQWDDQAGHLIDIMATIVDVTGVTYPTQYDGHVVLPMEGMSLKPTFTASNDVPRTLGFEHESNRAWISGSWKFVTKNFDLVTGTSPADELELYDLSKDGSEMTNLASVQPVLLNQMITNWNAWATRVGVPSSRLVTIDTNISAALPATNASDLFVDTFNRPNNTDTDASAQGMWGSRVPPIGANAAYYEGFEGSGSATSIEIVDNYLKMAVGSGMSENGLMHNFVGQDIVDAGGFSVELTVQEINSDLTDTANRYVGFGVGLSQTEAAAGGDVGDTTGIIFRGKQSNTANPGVSDFFVELDIDGNVKVWHDGTLLDTVPVGQNYGTLTASFACAGFTTNDTVTVNVFFNGQPVDINTADPNSMSRTFQWDRNNSNYIGLSARASNYAQMDNLAIRKLPLTADLAINYAIQHGLSGPDTAPGADPDGDGVNNFGEWAFGGDPTAADPFIASLRGTLITPTRDFQFDYQRLINAAGFGVRYRYFVSEDLNTWIETTPVEVNASTNEDSPAYEIVTMQLPASAIAGKNKLFLRVLAESAN